MMEGESEVLGHAENNIVDLTHERMERVEREGFKEDKPKSKVRSSTYKLKEAQFLELSISDKEAFFVECVKADWIDNVLLRKIDAKAKARTKKFFNLAVAGGIEPHRTRILFMEALKTAKEEIAKKEAEKIEVSFHLGELLNEMDSIKDDFA